MSGIPVYDRFRRWAGAALALALFGLGCATAELPPAEATTPLTTETLRRTQEMYLYPDRMDRRMLVGAMDSLESRYDSVRFDAEEDADFGVLQVGSARAEVPLHPDFDGDRFHSILGRALTFVRDHIDEQDLDEDDDLEVFAIQGALRALDPYSTIFSGRSTEDFRIRFSGKLSGIGSRIGRRDGHLTAVTVFPKSPAQKAGLQDGDWIIAIDGVPTRPLEVSEAVDRIRGKAGTVVVLGVHRGEEDLEIVITRGKVQVPSIEARKLENDIGYARVFQVSATTAREFRKKLDELGELEGLVLDLRGNTGGSMRAATDLADLFLSRQLIVRVVSKDGQGGDGRRNRTIAGPRVRFRFPVIVLVDSATASAAEILSGALAPLGHVTIVGQTTFGKGLIQQVIPLPEKNLLKLTVAEYLLSNNRVIHEMGVEPDIELFPVSTSRLGELAHVPEGAIAYLRKPGEDDTFPLTLAEALLTDDAEVVLAETRARLRREIAVELAERGIPWKPSDTLPAELPQPLEIESASTGLIGGREGLVAISVHNPNDFPIADAWFALSGAPRYLSNKLAPLGRIGAGESATAEITLEPPEGLSVSHHPARVYVASGDRPVQSEKLTLRVESQDPSIEIEVARLGEDELRVVLRNRGQHAIGTVRVAVPGATRTVEALAVDAREEVTLPLSARVDKVSVTLLGPWAQRRITVPIPETLATVVPPAVWLDRGGFPGRPQIRLHASSPEGLRRGWIRLDGQKRAYVAWGGEVDGTLRTPLSDDAKNVTTKVETLSGVSIIDLRRIKED